MTFPSQPDKKPGFLNPEDCKTLLESFAQAFWETDAQGQVVTDSPSWRAHTGQTAEAWLKDGWLGAIHPDDQPKARRDWEESIRHKVPFNTGIRLLNPEGGWLWANLSAAPMLNSDGSVKKWLGIVIDIHLQKEVESTLNQAQLDYQKQLELKLATQTIQLDENRELLRATLDSCLEMIQVFEAVRDEKNQIVDFVWVLNNKGSEYFYGDVIGKSLLALNPGVVEEGIFETFKRVVETGLPDQSKYYVHEQFNGWFYQSTVKLYDGVATTTSNITDRKRAEEELQQSRKLLQAIIDAPNIGVAVFRALRNEKGDIVDYVHESINRASIAMLGEDFTGKLLSDHGENGTLQFPQFREVIETGKSNSYVREIDFRGSKVWFAITNTSLNGDRLVHTWEDVTERKNAQAEILRLKDEVAKRATDRYYTLFNAVDEGICLIEMIYDEAGQAVDFRFLEVNEVYSRETGTQNPTGKLASEVTPNLEPVWLETYGKVAKTGERVRFENYHKDSGRWYHLFASRVGEENSSQVAIVFNDITERKLFEQQQDYLLKLNDATRSKADPVEIEKAVTQVAMDFFGADRCYYAAIHDDVAIISRDASRGEAGSVAGVYRLSDFEIFKQVVEGGVPLIVYDVKDTTLIDETLREICLRLDVISFIDVPVIKEGKPSGILSLVQSEPRKWTEAEIQLAIETAERTWAAVERAKAEAALIQSEENFRRLGIASSDSIFKVSPDWTQMRQLIGNTFLAEFNDPDSSWLDAYIPAEEQPSVKEKILEAIRTQTPFVLEHRVRRADGTVGWSFSRAIPVFDENGVLREWLGAASNITARKQAEEALREADRRKDEFLAMLAHELRNPMSTIRSGLKLLSMTSGNEAALHTTLEMMNRQTDHLVRLVDDLLDVSRISRGKIELRRERVNLVNLVRQAAESVRTLYQEQDLHLEVSLPPTPIYLEGDATRLTQVVINLLTNGARYTTEQGHVWLRLTQQTNDAGRPEAIIQVQDNGIGVPADQLSAIFEPFVQVDNSLARTKGGLGLGLTLVRQLVEMHGGEVQAQSAGLGKGSTFTVSLPALALPAEPTTALAHDTHEPRSARRVLVVDDNQDAAFLLAMLLKIKGYETLTRNSGRACLETAEDVRPAAIILDIGMPEMDGCETCRLIRQQPWGKEVKIIAVTGYGQEEDRRQTREAGFDEHLVKPVDFDSLTRCLTELLDYDKSKPV